MRLQLNLAEACQLTLFESRTSRSAAEVAVGNAICSSGIVSEAAPIRSRLGAVSALAPLDWGCILLKLYLFGMGAGELPAAVDPAESSRLAAAAVAKVADARAERGAGAPRCPPALCVGLRVVAVRPLCVRACSVLGVRCAPAGSRAIRALFAGGVVLFVGMCVHVGLVCVGVGPTSRSGARSPCASHKWT